MPDSMIEVDAVHIRIVVGDFLHEKWSTVTKAVLPMVNSIKKVDQQEPDRDK